MAKISKTMLNNSGESGQPCLLPDLSGNGFNFSPLRMMLALGLSYMAFVMLSILSCVCRPSVYLLWRNVYLDLLPIFGLGCSFFCY